MNLKTKKILAKELLFLIISMAICLSSYFLGIFIDDRERENYNKESVEIERIGTEWNILLEEFRKDARVDSIFKLQSEFHEIYTKSYSVEEIDKKNYFFWKNVRKSIDDKTFHFTYASDEIVESFDYYFRRILFLFDANETKDWSQMGKKELFLNFALNNNYEKYISKNDWKKYEDLREEHYSLLKKHEEIQYWSPRNSENFFIYAFGFSLGVLFFLRYVVYLLIWIFRTLKETPQSA